MNSFFKAIVAVSILVLAPSANAVECFSGGKAGDCSGAISMICSRVNGVLFDSGETISICVNINGYRCDMSVHNTGGGGSAIGVQQCVDDMTDTNNQCQSHGGIQTDGNFQLTLDPNFGSC